MGGLIGEGKLGPPLCVVFEGGDASGKGGAIKRARRPARPAPRARRSIAAPTYDEKRHHWLWRFWPLLPGWGGMAVLDRSWYGRVLVERVEGFATEPEWNRAYDEINDFERSLALEGMILVKFWLDVSPDEQLKRFEARAKDPLKQLEADRRGLAQPREAARLRRGRGGDGAADGHAVGAVAPRRGRLQAVARVKVVETVVARVESALAAG